ncbi:hypothetical protein SEA_INKED_34 [Arthrobacter phage Inked]|nr:hypothetical protein SEA_INKED_34 [Arthrobacter phage Inked]
MDETWKQILQFLGTAGGVAFLAMVGKGAKKIWSGAAFRERVKTTNLVRRTEAAEKKTDEAQAEMEAERKLRLKAEFHVSVLERQVVSLGGSPLKNPKDQE